MEQDMLDAMNRLFAQMQKRIAEFGKDTYDESFQSFLDEHGALWEMMTAPLMEETDAETAKKGCEEVAVALAKQAEEIRGTENRKSRRDRMQLELNLYMVSYVLPALLEYCRLHMGAKSGEISVLTDAICEAWAGYPGGGHIEAADYQSIKSGFKTKLCFVTTAVCNGLHKAPECEEIRLMKQYRDEYLLAQPGGEQLVKEYYNIAPTIVKRIARAQEPEAEYQYLWDHYISRCVALAGEGREEECRDVYEEMMLSLKDKYLVTNTH